MPDGPFPLPAASPPQDAGPGEQSIDSESKNAPVRDYTLPITLFALALRLLVTLVVAKTTPAQWLFSQASELGCLANSLLHGQGLSSPFGGQTGPSAFLAPGYPLFIAAIFRLFGPCTKHSAECVVLLQALFGAATVPAAMWTARQAFGVRAGNLAGVLCAVNPWLIGMEAVFWETSLSILLLTALVGLAIAIQQGPSHRLWYTAALVLAVAVAVNPSLIFTGLALFFVAAILESERRSLVWLMPAALFLGLSSVWCVRNYEVLHAFIPLRSNMGYELWQGNRPGADGFFHVQLHPNTDAQEYQQYRSLGEVAYTRQKSALATSWITNHPQRFSILTLKRVVCFWSGIGRTTTALTVISTALLSLGGLSAFLVLFRSDRKLAAVFAVPLLLLPLPYYISHPDFRFWCLLAPTLTILVSGWLLKLQRNSTRSEGKALAVMPRNSTASS